MKFSNIYIPTYIICSPESENKKIFIEKEFSKRKEFQIQFVEFQNSFQRSALEFECVKNIIDKITNENDDDVIAICTENHVFTSYYNCNKFLNQVIDASEKGVDILLGGVHGFRNMMPINKNLFWVDYVCGCDFILVFRSAFSLIANYKISEKDTFEEFIYTNVHNKLVVYPFISSKNMSCLDIDKNEYCEIQEYINDRINTYIRIIDKYNINTLSI